MEPTLESHMNYGAAPALTVREENVSFCIKQGGTAEPSVPFGEPGLFLLYRIRGVKRYLINTIKFLKHLLIA